MGDNTTNQNQNNSLDNLLSSVEADVAKSRVEGLKAKIKDKVKTRDEHTRSANQIQAEIDKMIADAKLGIF